MSSVMEGHAEAPTPAADGEVPTERRSIIGLGLSAAAAIVLSACESVVGVPRQSRRVVSVNWWKSVEASSVGGRSHAA